MQPPPELLALVQGCKDTPADDRPRLVLADWLEEHGDPYAGVVRLGCEAERLDESDPRRLELERAVEQALRRAQPDWLAGWRRITPHVQPVRGLLAVNVDMDSRLDGAEPTQEMWSWVERFTLDHGEEGAALVRNLPSSAGLTELDLDTSALTTVDLGDLLEQPALATLTALTTSSVVKGEVGLRQVLQAKGLKRLTRLKLELADLKSQELRTLARSELAGRLTHLGLSANYFGSSGAAVLAAEPGLSGLQGLDISCALCGNAGLTSLCRAAFPQLRTFQANANNLASGAVGQLRRAAWLGGLQELILDNNQFGEADVLALAGADLGNLRKLSLCFVEARDAGALALAAAPWLGGLRCLDLNQNVLSARAARALAAVPFERLTNLSLAFNSLGDEGMQALAGAAGLSRLRELVVQANDVGPQGARALAGSSVLTSLRYLFLSQSEIGDAGMAALAESPILAPLCVLGLSGCEITSAGVEALTRSPYIRRLRHLNLDSNRIYDDGARTLAESPNLEALETLSVVECGISDAGKACLEARFPWVEVDAP